MSGYSAFESPARSRSAKGQLHAVLVQAEGVGVLLIGDSGVGKTECAIELVKRGHSLIADDAVQVFFDGEQFVGRAPEIIRSVVHRRGLGITDIAQIVGRSVIRDECSIDLCIEISDAVAKEPPFRISNFFEERVVFHRIVPGKPAIAADSVESIVKQHIKRSDYSLV
ncbi:MAG: hypothetical protein DMF63_13035 [Acidobacteria bacterium]|nr:MAG: hypothetical protein DMF63_13035 [Acidobacteriota bacterium]